MKKLFSILLMLAVVVACALLPSIEAEAVTGEDVILDLADGVCSYEGFGNAKTRNLPHVPVVDEGYPALCGVEGLTDGSHCGVCGEVLVAQTVIPALEHDIQYFDAKIPTYSSVGWEDYECCSRCSYSTYVEIPALETPSVETYEDFVTNLALLEEIAYVYIQENPGKDPANLVIKYIRTGVDRYNSGSWGIMAGYEDAAFAQFVAQIEDMINSEAEDVSQMICVTSLKDIKVFTVPNGDRVDFGHMFGTMDITYHNNYSVNHADVAGWAGDLVDLLSTADRHAVTGTMEEMIATISENYLNKSLNESDTFGLTDMYGDLDGFYVMQTLQKSEYENGLLTAIIAEYFTEDLTDEDRAEYFLQNRLGGVSTRGDVRAAVFNAYSGNKVVTTLEGTREFTADNLDELKMACNFAFADYICKLAGDYVEVTENPYYSVFSSNSAVLAPGITQKIEMATSADGKQMVYYLATADLRRDDVHIYANYNNNDPAAGWAMQRVLDQANAAQKKYGDPNSKYYIPNYNVIASINGAGFNMSTGEPSGLLIMNGTVYQDVNNYGFFGILKDGTAVIGTKQEYLTIYKDQVAEGIAGFGTTLVENGQICVAKKENYYSDRASRTAIGITRTGKVVFMVLDGRQEPWSCGGSMQEIAQIMLEAGCVHAINLDGGGSTTYVAKQEGADALSVVSRPSDGVSRSVSTSLLMVSTAPSSTTFDHAILNTPTNYMTVGSTMQVTPSGVSATGNATDIPEGATWAVSSTRWATITADGQLTALRNGSVEVYLMLDGEIIGSKTVHIVIPSQIYFVKPQMNAVYGQPVELPVKAVYEGKPVTIRPEDIVFSMSNPKAGAMNGFCFIGNETAGIKMVVVTASLANDDSVCANITLNLYKQGENSFDFEQATGGDRELAWDREVSNATTEDSITYTIVDQNKDMVTSYVFAIDMTQIPIPAQLEDLIYMLPGADMEGASAWNFLLQLAERVSALSEVKPVLRFDPNVDVDYSELKLVTDYFTLTSTEFDEQTNTLTLTLNWIKQTQPIDPAMANPLCLVTGIKITPKENVSWGDKSQLTVVNSGDISYQIFLRASGLYSFAQKPENQAIYGVYAYVNPDNSADKGGCFGSVYHTFEDTYTLVKTLKNGWMNVEGGFAYYKDGEQYFGICKVAGLYYNFGENGINVGKTTYSGLLEDGGKTYYAKNGETITGWQAIGDDWYLFDSTGAGVNGNYRTIMDGITITYEMDNGRLGKGFWYKDAVGLKYYYGPYCYHKGWKTINGEKYFFENYYAHTGVHPVRESHSVIQWWYEFAEDGKLIGEAADGFYWFNGELYYVIDTIAVSNGMNLINGDYYYFNANGAAVRNQSVWVSKTNNLVVAGTYRFGVDGKLILTAEVVNENGTLYYYKDGKRTASAGLVESNGNYYYIDGSAKAVVNKVVWVSKTNGLKDEGTYRFDAEGKMLLTTGVVEEDGKLYYYENGKRTNGGLVEYKGDYYYFASGDTALCGKSAWVGKTNGLVEVGTYRFDANGKMIRTTEVVNEGGIYYYYYEGKRTANAGLIEFNGAYYYIDGSCAAVVNKTIWASKTNGLKPVGSYSFDAEGKMIRYNGIVDGYYYVDGVKTAVGVIKIDGYYYYVTSGGLLTVNKTAWVSATNGMLSVGTYRFDAEGKMLMTTGVVEENGKLYYYENGKRTNGGLVEYKGDYYYFISDATAVLNMTAWVGRPNGLVDVGTYRFDADGKMILTTEVVNENGIYYYYRNGKRTASAGLIEFNGEYYYIDGAGTAVTNRTIWVNNTNGLKPAGSYMFDECGKMIRLTGIMNGYYYKDGAKNAAGLVLIDGTYYYASGGGKLITNQSFWTSNTNNLLPQGTYRADADGKLIMTTEIVRKGDVLYYYQNGKRTANAGLVQFGGDYYYIDGVATAVVNRSVSVSKTNGLLKAGTYYFGADGKLVFYNGIVDGYYYVNGVKTAAGLLKIGNDYYFATSGGQIIAGRTFWLSTNDQLPSGTYRADAEGKLILTTEVVDENGTLYYYENGKRTTSAGLVLFDGSYYYIDSSAKAVVGKTVWVTKTNGLMAAGTYTFGADGKMIR